MNTDSNASLAPTAAVSAPKPAATAALTASPVPAVRPVKSGKAPKSKKQGAAPILTAPVSVPAIKL